MRFIKNCKGQLLVTVLLLFLLFAAPFSPYEEQHFDSAKINVDGSTASITSFFPKGAYEVQILLSEEASGLTAQVALPRYLNPDNTSGKVLETKQFPYALSQLTFSFSVESTSQEMTIAVQNLPEHVTLSDITCRSVEPLYRDPLLFAGILLLGSALLLLYRRTHTFSAGTFFLLTFAACFASLPMAAEWLRGGHDTFFHYSRLCALAEGLKSGALPMRISPGLFQEFGYAQSIFYPDLFLYPAAFFGTLGMSPIGMYQFLVLGINFATVFLSYYAFSRLCRSKELGTLASLMYTFSIYRLTDLYTRGAIGEVLAMIFLPLLMLGMYELFYGESRRWPFAMLAFTGILQSHIITTELAILFSVIFGLCSILRLREKRRILHLLCAGVGTLLLNLWFILPLLHHAGYPVSAFSQPRNLASYGLYLNQLFDFNAVNAAGDALSRGINSGEMPYSLGLMTLTGILLLLFVLLQKKHFQKRSLAVWCLSLGGLALYASTIHFPWEALQKIEIINRLASSLQFPFRFLSLASAFLALAAALGFYYTFDELPYQKAMTAFGMGFALLCASVYLGNYCEDSYLYASRNTMSAEGHHTDSMYLIDSHHTSGSVINSRKPVFVPSEQTALSACRKTGSSAAFHYKKASAEEDAYVDAPLNYYPCYQAVDENGASLKVSEGAEGRLRIYLPQQQSGEVSISYKIPLMYRMGDCLSLLTALFFWGYFLFSFKKLQIFHAAGIKKQKPAHPTSERK